ncbi:hypothetical protein M4D54_10785 [Brachybacterium sp. p3-SID1565]|uniref:Uncharacterized protein n=1 Tax=Brachybacterium epidermidis TaxID=2781983 RepID=A0ABR9VZ46_9MICO|nr:MULTISPECIES: hypothetical protein [Brachybacterium]MBE9403457.1 hypothetical protein [Brachybacterium epidermidis]MCT1386101.1 hypothetical protein [Brachybacterium sp. p3-SID1565]
MYAWMFRRLPGPLWVRILITLVILAALVVVLFGWVFPAISPYMPFNDGLVGSPSPGAGGTAGMGAA